MSGQAEDPAVRLRRLRMRAWRRGIKEMDLILGPYADSRLADLSPAELDLFEEILDCNDQDLLAWSTGAGTAPAQLAPLLERMVAHARANIPGKAAQGA
ncbi:hypothetical protein BV394_03685 [Brevirhabdus pacifica]|uniref:FAD assembly factor SdhE n=1 Tax=Brevirhabdus pacifica TaxID=1267768 RepID=A0A1U7DGB7_9RHOB|nr:succinate dehydrogenase assembly factor 2 [Brevirhabdus pacifica]APX88939.1 hypothetical protein BV394_03685 [Brevirhabdus pacifica]OWU80165.1 hypothetical protein ATO5_04370 [Loktanella sp. 22II-4b]PJJ86508.1 antitoxin CptB [Brevirhabdus pacifica]